MFYVVPKDTDNLLILFILILIMRKNGKFSSFFLMNKNTTMKINCDSTMLMHEHVSNALTRIKMLLEKVIGNTFKNQRIISSRQVVHRQIKQ